MWSGVQRLVCAAEHLWNDWGVTGRAWVWGALDDHRCVCAATDVDVRMLMHDTGPVFEDSFKYLRSKGLQATATVQPFWL